MKESNWRVFVFAFGSTSAAILLFLVSAGFLVYQADQGSTSAMMLMYGLSGCTGSILTITTGAVFMGLNGIENRFVKRDNQEAVRQAAEIAKGNIQQAKAERADYEAMMARLRLEQAAMPKEPKVIEGGLRMSKDLFGDM